jgi:tight adherence protein B
VLLLLIVAFGAGAYLLYDGLTRSRLAPTHRRRLRWVEEWLLRAGLREVTPRDFALFSLATGLVSGLIAQLWLAWAVVSVCAALLGALIPTLYYRQRHDRRRAALQDALVEAITQLRDGIRAGLSVQEALLGLTRNGPQALRPEFILLVREMRLLGFERAMAGMRDRLADPVFDIVVTSLVWNDRMGGRNISQVLDRLAHATREQLRLQHELRAYQAKNVLAARIVAAVPLAVLVGVRQVDAPYLSVFNSFSGQLLLAGCVASIALGYAAMLWLTRLPGERRILQ